jgi:hypothetical protein
MATASSSSCVSRGCVRVCEPTSHPTAASCANSAHDKPQTSRSWMPPRHPSIPGHSSGGPLAVGEVGGDGDGCASITLRRYVFAALAHERRDGGCWGVGERRDLEAVPVEHVTETLLVSGQITVAALLGSYSCGGIPERLRPIQPIVRSCPLCWYFLAVRQALVDGDDILDTPDVT